MKVLILCNDFPPINSIGAERPYSWFKYFKQFGVDSIVITKNWETDGSSAFNTIANNRKVEDSESGVIIRAAYAPTVSTMFYDKFGLKFSLLRRMFSFMEKFLAFVSFRFDRHRNIYNEASKYLEQNSVDAIITTGEPFLLFRHGYLLKRKFNVKWIMDYRDGWYLNHVSSLRKGLLNKLIRRYELYFEKKYAYASDMILTVDPQLAGRISKLVKKEVKVVYNGFWDYIKNQEGIKYSDKLILNHTGTLTVGQRAEFLLDSVVDLVSNGQLKKEAVEINFIGLDYFPEQAKRVKNYHPILKNIVKTTPRLSKEEADQRNLQADYLINFTDPNLSAIYAKTYNYIACNRPILVIPADHGLLDKIVVENKLGFTFETKDELKLFLTSPRLPNASSENMDFFKRKKQTEIFVKYLTELNGNR